MLETPETVEADGTASVRAQAVLIRRSGEVTGSHRLGGKIGSLAALGRSHLPVPAWFAVTPEAFHASLTEQQRRELEEARTPEAIRAVAETVAPSEELRAELSAALAEICAPGERVAVRSSALDEDGAHHSFAGQLDSFLFVSPEEAADRVADVWRSGFSERVLAYRQTNGLPLLAAPPAVLVQRMVDADVSGVSFGADPVSGRRSVAVVGALYGVGTALVSGECDADTWHVDRWNRIIHRQIAEKVTSHRMGGDSAEGVTSVPVAPELRSRPALTDGQIQAVARLVRRAGRHFGRPQDIEWAMAGGRLYLLQSRPITSLFSLADPDAPLAIWDNSNIVESYSGVTTPLTFTFARRAYEAVYREFCRILQVPGSRIESSDAVFANMLGIVRGRVYYNLLNWYRVLALLPGFTVNRRFMEQMMGVREGLPDEVAREIQSGALQDRLLDSLALLRTVAGLVVSHWRLPRSIEAFHARLNSALATPGVPLGEMRLDELAGHYLDLERRLLRRWDAPLVNDFLAMIFYGVLRKLVAGWCGDTHGTLQNDLLCAEGGMISAEPAQRIRRMAEIASADEELALSLSRDSLPQIQERLRHARSLRKELRAYLAKFGDRCLEELKLETETLEDDPLPLLRSVGELALRLREGTPLPHGIDREIRAKAETEVRRSLAGHPIRQRLFAWVLRNARGRVRDRENLRFERTRVFGRVRRIFLEMGRRLYALNLLEEPRDVFYLELSELLGTVQGTATTADLKGIVRVRRTEYDRYRDEQAPPERFETRGLQSQPLPAREAAAGSIPADGESRSGIGCCPGIVRAQVRVITTPKGAVLRRGQILVAERTDPGWIMLFPSAAGVLVERGSLLSHSAIVSREMGIPSIVSIQGLMNWLSDGDWVEMDGSTGIVRRVPPPEENE